MKKQILILTALFVFAAGIFTSCEPKNPDDPGGGGTTYGNGTAADPFKVATVADLKRVGSGEEGPGGKEWKYDKHYLQTANIDLKDIENWTPICPYISIWSNAFSGVYDGGGYTISNLTIVGEDSYIGLFGRYVKGTIRNVHLTKVNLLGQSQVGSLAGSLTNGGKIEHCSVNDFNITGHAWVAGLAGEVDNGATVSNCIVTNGDVFNNESGWTGGVTGSNSGTIQNCYVTATVYGHGSTGGVVGNNYGMVQYCYVVGNVTSESAFVGGIAGRTYGSGKIQNCAALSKEVIRTSGSSVQLGRITDNSGSDNPIYLNNYARFDMILMANTNIVPLTDATTTGKDGADVLPADYNGANSATWWSSVANFPASSWDFAPNRLPHLKGFDGLTQNPTVTP